eukprot:Tamp_19199.p1 GENE.Tamp_19199~~Tamp_19199.p1  ORF type:complete len:419 (+),score=53.80 Tamp_19199:25-1257(+)
MLAVLVCGLLGRGRAFQLTTPGRGPAGRAASLGARPAAPAAPAAPARRRRTAPAFAALRASASPAEPDWKALDQAQQAEWEVFRETCEGKWQAVWQTYDFIGDKKDETTLRVELLGNEEELAQAHVFEVQRITSTCDTCHDSEEEKRMEVAKYGKGKLGRHCLVGDGYVNGPVVLRSGAMSTELALRCGDGRVRISLQHAPVWLKGNEGLGPPDALKLFRCIVMREALRAQAPTPQGEKAEPPTEGNPIFWRPVSPFKWHALWGGMSLTRGKTQGVQAWSVDELQEVDAWHGRPRGDDPNVWTLRLPGGILIQVPTLVRGGEIETFRAAWLCMDEKLMRIEARIMALQNSEELADGSVRILPPSLLFAQVDDFDRRGALPNVGQLDPEWVKEQNDWINSGGGIRTEDDDA